MCAAVTTTNRVLPVVAIAVACDAARDRRCKDGAVAFRQYWARYIGPAHPLFVWEAAPEDFFQDGTTPIDIVARTSRWLAGTTRRLTQNHKRFLVIGGDHSCAIGTWSGAADALRHSGLLGLIWIDAYLDMRRPATMHSGAINSMPVATLLGYGTPELASIFRSRGAISPNHICLIGARSFEREEIAFSRRHDVRVIGMDELSRRGIEAACAEARAIAGRCVAGYGVSLDLDAFDPADAPGVGTPEPGGIRANEFRAAWADLTCGSLCIGVEIVEYNPYRDRADRTARLIGDLIARTVSEKRLRWAS
jgi:arginase